MQRIRQSRLTSTEVRQLVKKNKLPDTKTAQWPAESDVATYTHGQVSSTYYMDEIKRFNVRP